MTITVNYYRYPKVQKADALKQQFTKLGVVKTDYYTLDFDSAVTVNLK